jgi:ATP-dependent exoDNAse (exonuclease V) beta subunit
MAAARALADPTDQLALVAALRSPLFGCGDDELYTFKRDGGSWNYLAPLPDSVEPEHPVADALTYLGGLHQQVPWLTPSELLQQLVADRRLLELAYASGRPRDLWRRLRFVIDQARAWSESEGGALRHYLDWARLQASESARVAETVLPETDDDSVRILTIHGSKGLEFPITIVSGMTSRGSGRTNRVEVVWPTKGPVAIKVGPSLKTPEFEAYQPVDEQMDFHERLRLLYVACTRAQDHLVVSLHRTQRRSEPKEERKCSNAELVVRAIEGAPHQRPLEGSPTPLSAPATPAGEPLIDVETWQAKLDEVLSSSARRRSVGASDLELDAELDADTAAGAQKGARDLELPAWQKGRYGTAIGRAVHAVLQTVDLSTGAGVDEAAAAQAAAEGVLGREADIAQLARSALTAPAVREAVTCRRWRETYVATQVGDRTLEGYIDLLYRTDAGLVVVDYKTASSSADLDRRVAGYRSQGGAYAVAVEQATGEAVARVVFVFLTSEGAFERELRDLDDAKAAVRKAVDSLE